MEILYKSFSLTTFSHYLLQSRLLLGEGKPQQTVLFVQQTNQMSSAFPKPVRWQYVSLVEIPSHKLFSPSLYPGRDIIDQVCVVFPSELLNTVLGWCCSALLLLRRACNNRPLIWSSRGASNLFTWQEVFSLISLPECVIPVLEISASQPYSLE